VNQRAMHAQSEPDRDSTRAAVLDPKAKGFRLSGGGPCQGRLCPNLRQHLPGDDLGLFSEVKPPAKVRSLSLTHNQFRIQRHSLPKLGELSGLDDVGDHFFGTIVARVIGLLQNSSIHRFLRIFPIDRWLGSSCLALSITSWR